jgi:hypothetical protein
MVWYLSLFALLLASVMAHAPARAEDRSPANLDHQLQLVLQACQNQKAGSERADCFRDSLDRIQPGLRLKLDRCTGVPVEQRSDGNCYIKNIEEFRKTLKVNL